MQIQLSSYFVLISLFFWGAFAFGKGVKSERLDFYSVLEAEGSPTLAEHEIDRVVLVFPSDNENGDGAVYFPSVKVGDDLVAQSLMVLSGENARNVRRIVKRGEHALWGVPYLDQPYNMSRPTSVTNPNYARSSQGIAAGSLCGVRTVAKQNGENATELIFKYRDARSPTGWEFVPVNAGDLPKLRVVATPENADSELYAGLFGLGYRGSRVDAIRLIARAPMTNNFWAAFTSDIAEAKNPSRKSRRVRVFPVGAQWIRQPSGVFWQESGDLATNNRYEQYTDWVLKDPSFENNSGSNSSWREAGEVELTVPQSLVGSEDGVALGLSFREQLLSLNADFGPRGFFGVDPCIPFFGAHRDFRYDFGKF